MNQTHDTRHLIIALPGGRVARIPAEILEGYVVSDGTCVHGDPGEEDVGVSAHHLSVDATIGSHEWHADFELGECDYLDASGFPQRKNTWHRHPFGTEYAELYEVQ